MAIGVERTGVDWFLKKRFAYPSINGFQAHAKAIPILGNGIVHCFVEHNLKGVPGLLPVSFVDILKCSGVLTPV